MLKTITLCKSVNHRGRVTHALGDDALARALMDSNSPTEGLESFDEWTIDLRKLNMGEAFAQGAFGKPYRGTYKGENVAIKILERPKNDPGKAQVMKQQFQQEVMMLATLKHPNIVHFIGACRKVHCDRVCKRGFSPAIPNKAPKPISSIEISCQTSLGCSKGAGICSSAWFDSQDLKSDNLLIFTDKSIKIADFGVARIEVQTEGMTPETGTYRWMGPEDF